MCKRSYPQPSDKISIVAYYILIYKPPMLQLAGVELFQLNVFSMENCCLIENKPLLQKCQLQQNLKNNYNSFSKVKIACINLFRTVTPFFILKLLLQIVLYFKLRLKTGA